MEDDERKTESIGVGDAVFGHEESGALGCMFAFRIVTLLASTAELANRYSPRVFFSTKYQVFR